jgi:nicotinamide-nucleotide amidase
MAQAQALLHHRLGDLVVAEGEGTMDGVLAAMLRKAGLTLALAESCSGGLIAKRITDLPGSSDYFLQGVVSYSNAAKERLLGVPADLLERHGAVSREVAIAMASGVRTTAGSDLGLAVTGIAGPAGGSGDKPVGTVFIALADKDGYQVCPCSFSGDREAIRVMTAWKALDLLRRHLLALIKDDLTGV